MPQITCYNTECLAFDSYVSVNSVKVTIDNKGNEVVSQICPQCGKNMCIVIEEGKAKQFNFGRIKSMGKEDLKQELHKRAQKHYKKYDKKMGDQKRHETIEAIKEKFERNIKKP